LCVNIIIYKMTAIDCTSVHSIALICCNIQEGSL